MSRLIYTLLFLSMVVVSCKKDKDEEPPQVLISSPTENERFDVLESVPVKAQISDNEVLETITLSLISTETNTRAMEAKIFNPGGTDYNLNYQFDLSDSLLKGGNYYFRLEASDGENIGTDFQYIQLNPIPRKRISALVSCSDGGVSSVYELNDQGSKSLVNSYSNSTLTTVFNSYDQDLWFLPLNGKTLSVYQLNESSEVYSEQVSTNYTNLFTDIDLSDREVFVSHKEGEVYGYRPTYGQNFLYRSANDRYCNKVEAGEKYVMAEEVGVDGNNRFLMVLFKVSGAAFTSIGIQQAVADLAFLNQDQGLVIQNSNGNAVLKEVNFETSSLRLLKNINGETAKRIIKIDASNFLISTSQAIYRYDYSQNNLSSVIQGLSNPVMAYDDLRNTILLGEGSQLREFDLSNGGLVSTNTFPNSIKSINLRYNRN